MLTVWKAAQMRVKKMKWQSQRKRNQAQREQTQALRNNNSDVVRKGTVYTGTWRNGD